MMVVNTSVMTPLHISVALLNSGEAVETAAGSIEERDSKHASKNRSVENKFKI